MALQRANRLFSDSQSCRVTPPRRNADRPAEARLQLLRPGFQLRDGAGAIDAVGVVDHGELQLLRVGFERQQPRAAQADRRCRWVLLVPARIAAQGLAFRAVQQIQDRCQHIRGRMMSQTERELETGQPAASCTVATVDLSKQRTSSAAPASTARRPAPHWLTRYLLAPLLQAKLHGNGSYQTAHQSSSSCTYCSKSTATCHRAFPGHTCQYTSGNPSGLSPFLELVQAKP